MSLALSRVGSFHSVIIMLCLSSLQIKNFNYPEALRDLTFRWDYMVKGLIIDKNRGNTLKVGFLMDGQGAP